MKLYKQKRKLVEIKCSGCNCTFKKPESEYKRNISKNRNNYCSRPCAGRYSQKNVNVSKLNTKNLIADNRKDVYTPYKYYMKLINQRFKKTNVTLLDLHNQWEIQKGICPYSGIQLILSTHSKIEKNPIVCASLDRIDSTKGYVIGNIQFTSRAINYMKGEMSHEDTLRLCKIITQHHK